MAKEMETKWGKLVRKFEKDFGSEINLSAILFLIGVQELGMGFRKFGRDEKLNIMHIATCSLLEQFGYYEKTGKDNDGWPHWKRAKKIPPLNSDEQTKLLKTAILKYFKTS